MALFILTLLIFRPLYKPDHQTKKSNKEDPE